MFKKLPGNVREDSGKCPEDSGESSRRFGGIPEKVLGKVQEDFEELSKRFREMFEMNNRGMIENIPENVTKDFKECSFGFMDLFCEIWLIFITFYHNGKKTTEQFF